MSYIFCRLVYPLFISTFVHSEHTVILQAPETFLEHTDPIQSYSIYCIAKYCNMAMH